MAGFISHFEFLRGLVALKPKRKYVFVTSCNLQSNFRACWLEECQNVKKQKPRESTTEAALGWGLEIESFKVDTLDGGEEKRYFLGKSKKACSLCVLPKASVGKNTARPGFVREVCPSPFCEHQEQFIHLGNNTTTAVASSDFSLFCN